MRATAPGGGDARSARQAGGRVGGGGRGQLDDGAGPQRHGDRCQRLPCLSVTVTCVMTWMLMRSASRVDHLTPNALRLSFARAVGLLLAAMAVELLAGVIRDMLRPF